MPKKLPDRWPDFAINIAAAAAFASAVCIGSPVGPLFAQTATTPSTDGVASASERVYAPVAPPVSSVLPDRPMAITGEPMMMPPNAFANAASKQDSVIQIEPSGVGVKSSARIRTPKHAK